MPDFPLPEMVAPPGDPRPAPKPATPGAQKLARPLPGNIFADLVQLAETPLPIQQVVPAAHTPIFPPGLSGLDLMPANEPPSLEPDSVAPEIPEMPVAVPALLPEQDATEVLLPTAELPVTATGMSKSPAAALPLVPQPAQPGARSTDPAPVVGPDPAPVSQSAPGATADLESTASADVPGSPAQPAPQPNAAQQPTVPFASVDQAVAAQETTRQPSLAPTGDSARPQAPITAPADTLRMLTVQLQPALAARPEGTIDVMLEPAELGRLHLSFSQGGDQLVVQVSAERADTLEFVRRHAALLEAELIAAGFEGIELGFNQPQSGNRPDRADEPEDRHQAEPAGQVYAPSPERKAAVDDVLDLRL